MYYFDNSATSQPLESVLETYVTVARDFFANPSSAHRLGETSKALMQEARKQIASILACQSHEVYFTASGTESNNWFLRSVIPALYDRSGQARKTIIISAIEHPSILKQVPFLEKEGYKPVILPVDGDGVVDLDVLKDLLSQGDVLGITTMAVNNEVGTIQNLTEIAKILEAYPQVIWHVDGVQAVTACLDSLKNKRIDCLSLSGHKFHAPRGVGIFIMKERVASYPSQYGGGQEQDLRSGTENLAGIVATAKALRIAQAQLDQAKTNLEAYKTKIIQALEENGWKVFAKRQASPHIICAALAPIPGEVLLHAFEAQDIFVSTTSACSSRSRRHPATLEAMGIDSEISQSAIRISLSQYTSQDQVDYLIKKIKPISQAMI